MKVIVDAIPVPSEIMPEVPVSPPSEIFAPSELLGLLIVHRILPMSMAPPTENWPMPVVNLSLDPLSTAV